MPENAEREHLFHTNSPVFDEKSEILILGTFPSVKSRETKFFYGNPQNRFWRVLAAVFGTGVPQSNEEKRAFLLNRRIALWDVISECDICGSSDSTIKNVVPNDIERILCSAKINGIFVNGATSERLYNRYLAKTTQLPAVRLPSTSPANASWSLERLCSAWKVILTYFEK